MKTKLCGIYCIENAINNKKYIGMSRDIKRRWSEHRHELRYHVHVNPYLQCAWDKYLEQNFKFYIIELCDEKLLSERECYYIQLYKTLSHENGYNLTTGGENTSIGKMVISLIDKHIYNFVYEAAADAGVTSITMTGWCRNKQKYMYFDEYNQLTEEEQKYWSSYDWDKVIHTKLSKAHCKENLSKQTSLKLSASTSGKNNPRAIRIYCPQLNEFFDYIKQASEKYGVNHGSISSCLKGKLKTAGVHPSTGERLTWIKA